jgi:hypothetical protein
VLGVEVFMGGEASAWVVGCSGGSPGLPVCAVAG